MRPVSLAEIAEELSVATDGLVQAVDRRTGEIVAWTWELGAEDADAHPDPRDDPERYAILPAAEDLPDWELLRDFAERQSGVVREALREAVQGRDALRRFREVVERHDLLDAWYAFRHAAYARIARRWLEEQGLAYVDDVPTPAPPPAMAPRLSLVTLGVADLDRAVAFYRDVLGLPQRPTPPGVAFFELGPTWLSLFPRGDLAADAGVPDDGGQGFPRFSLAHNVADEAAVDALIAHVAAHGGRIVKPPQRTSWGGYAAYFADPDGFLWEVAHNPDFPHV